MRVADYDATRRADLADLLGRVWGKRPDESELEWFYEQNPVRSASVVLAEEDGLVVGCAAITFQRMSIGGTECVVGMPMGVATDPRYRGRGIFGALQEANEGRARDAGIPLLLTVPNAASEPTFLRTGWTALPRVRAWARARLPWAGRSPARVARFTSARSVRSDDRVLRDEAWLNWRFVDGPRAYTLLQHEGGYAVTGRRGRLGVVAVDEHLPPGGVASVAGGIAAVAAPPPSEQGRYLRAGFLPTPKTFTVLGKPLAAGQRLPERPHFELGDLDFL